MTTTPLFSQIPLGQKTASVLSKAQYGIAQLRAADFANSTEQAVAATVYALYQLVGLTVDTVLTTQAVPVELPVQVTDANAPGGVRLVAGRRFSFSVPFGGSEEWLQTIPSTMVESTAFGEVKDGKILFSLQQPVNDMVESLVTIYQNNIAGIVANATTLNADIASFNESLQQQITMLVAERKAQIDRNYTDAEAFGVPIAA